MLLTNNSQILIIFHMNRKLNVIMKLPSLLRGGGGVEGCSQSVRQTVLVAKLLERIAPPGYFPSSKEILLFHICLLHQICFFFPIVPKNRIFFRKKTFLTKKPFSFGFKKPYCFSHILCQVCYTLVLRYFKLKILISCIRAIGK